MIFQEKNLSVNLILVEIIVKNVHVIPMDQLILHVISIIHVNVDHITVETIVKNAPVTP